MSQVQYFNLANSIVLRLDGKTYTLHKTDHRYPDIQKALDEKNYEGIFNLVDPTKVLNQEGFEVKSGVIFYKNEAIPTILGDQFLTFKINKVSFMSLVNFWMNLKNRTDFEHSREHIITLLQQRGYPVTEDGFIIAYKEEKEIPEVKFDPRKKIVTPFFNYGRTSNRIQSMFDAKKTLTQMCEEIFGFSSKKLLKLAVEKVFPQGNPFVKEEFFNIGIAFKGVLSPNNLFLVIEKNLYPAHLGNTGSHVAMNDFWLEFGKTKEGQISEKRILNLLQTKYHQHNLLACGEAWSVLKDKNLNLDLSNADFTADVEKIYRYLEREVKKLKNPEYDLKIESVFPKLAQVKDAKVEDLTVVLPKTNYDLAEWSRVMSNCIHGYGQRVLKGETMVLAVCDDKGKMIYNLEIVNGRVVQFRSKNNGRPEKQDYDKIMDFLFEKEIIHTLECNDVRF
jgi:hypothetical protein